jgi:hypothetical protein
MEEGGVINNGSRDRTWSRVENKAVGEGKRHGASVSENQQPGAMCCFSSHAPP